MRIYITASFKGVDNKDAIEQTCSVVRKAGFEDFCFIRDVENYKKIFTDVHEMMRRAKEEIEKCDILLIEYDGPGHGRMIELGIAYALNKKIILITKEETPIKETVAGVADAIIRYKNLKDIVPSLSQLYLAWR